MFFLTIIGLFTSLLTRFVIPAGARGQAEPQFLFVVLALLFLVVFVWLWLRGARMRYLLTNRRLVIDISGPFAKNISVPLEHVRFIELRSGLFGPDDLIFLETGHRSWGFKDDGFVAIADATQVEKLLREAIDQTFATHGRGPWE
jgi:hypothetical protein